MRCNVLSLLVAVGTVSSMAYAVDVPEAEPNDTKPTAQAVTLAPGDAITGTTTGAVTTAGDTSADNFLITASSAAPGIYRTTLTLTTTGTAGHTMTIRGLTQTTGGVINQGTDASIQTSFTQGDTSRLLAWYGFGAQEQVYVRVAGTASTTGAYTATLARTLVTPTPMTGEIQNAGQLSIVTGGGPDTEIWVYNADTLQPIEGFNNDDPTTGGLAAILTRDFPVGNYLLAFCDYNLQCNLGSPVDENFRGENVMDFANAICDSDREATFTAFAEIRQGGPTGTVLATANVSKSSDFEILWLSFTVGNPNPACPADLDDGSGTGTGDGAITIDDLLYFLSAFENGSEGADLDDDGQDPGQPDGAVTIDDLLFFLVHFEAGC